MDNLFQFLMYKVFGKKWLMFSMIEGYKVAIFMGRVQIEMIKPKHEKAEAEFIRVSNEIEKMKLRTDFESANAKSKAIEEFQSEVNLAKSALDLKNKEMAAHYDQMTLDKNKLNFLKGYKY